MKQINKMNGIYLDGDEVLYITKLDESNSFRIVFKGGEELEFSVGAHMKELIEPIKTLWWTRQVARTVIDRERLERDILDMKESREALINQLVN